MKNRILSYFIVVTVLLWGMFTSCEKDDLDNPTAKSNISADKTESRQVSSTQAKIFASMMANKLFTTEDNGAQLKSATADVVRTVESFEAIVSEETKDTVMFSVNFGDDKGFMIISGDKGDNPIIALSDAGSFDANRLPVSAEAWISEQKEYISHLMKEPLEDDNVVWIGIGSDSSEVNISFISELPKLKACRPDQIPSGRYTVSPYTGKVNEWGQGAGYNYDAKVKGALAGCPAVAIGQLCYDQRFPYDYYYSGMPNKLPSHYYNASSNVSRMFRSIADKIPGYSWGKDFSGALPNNILTGIKRLGYSNASIINFNIQTVYENLRRGRPVLLAAYQGSNGGGGHIWFCDGYWDAKVETVHRKRKWYGKWYTHCTWYEYHDYLYMNWGWDGTANGWYRSDTNDHWNPKNTNFKYQRKAYVNLYPVR